MNPKIIHFVFRNPLYIEAIADRDTAPGEDEIVGKDTLPYAPMVWIACRLIELTKFLYIIPGIMMITREIDSIKLFNLPIC